MSRPDKSPRREKESKREYERIPEADKGGGYKFVDTDAEVAAQRGVMWDMFRQIASNVTQRKNLINISMPVRLFEPRSYLERISDSWCLAPALLTAAAKSSDPVERLKLVVAFAIGGLHNTCTKKKPFNPILGETFEAAYPDGSRIYVEQTSHHPPITAWQVFGPEGLWHFYGYGEWAASFSVNSVSGSQKGIHVVRFADGGRVEYELPEISVKGILWGDRIMEYLGTVRFRDPQHRLLATVHIPPPSDGYFSSWWGASPPTDYLRGELVRLPEAGEAKERGGGGSSSSTSSKKGEVLAGAGGSWLGCVEWDAKSYWSVRTGPAVARVAPVADPLPSDCRFRADLVALAAGDLAAAHDQKNRLEELQRRDAKLRAAAKAKRGEPPSP